MVNFNPLIPFFHSKTRENDSNRIKIDHEREDQVLGPARSNPSSLRPQQKRVVGNSDPLIPFFDSKSSEKDYNRIKIH